MFKLLKWAFIIGLVIVALAYVGIIEANMPKILEGLKGNSHAKENPEEKPPG